MFNAEHKENFSKIEEDCECYTCKNYSCAYIAHLFRAKEMLAATLATVHNLHFITKLVAGMRQSILDNTFYEYKDRFFNTYRNI